MAEADSKQVIRKILKDKIVLTSVSFHYHLFPLSPLLPLPTQDINLVFEGLKEFKQVVGVGISINMQIKWSMCWKNGEGLTDVRNIEISTVKAH